MAQAANNGIPVILDVENAAYGEPLRQLFAGAGVGAHVVQTRRDRHGELIDTLERTGAKSCLYVSDHIDEELVARHRSTASLKVENVLLVDETRKEKLRDDQNLFLYRHVLSCAVDCLPQLPLVSTVRKMNARNYFGLDKYLAQSGDTQKTVLTCSRERQDFRDRLYDYVLGLSAVINRPTEMAAQLATEVQEELLMNAIWDANPRLKAVDRHVPVDLPPQEQVSVEWGFDGSVLGIAVRDSFGTFTDSITHRYLSFLFQGDARGTVRINLESNQGGAGLGLYMVLKRLNGFVVTVTPGRQTEVVALMTLTGSARSAAKRQRGFQYFSVPE